MIELLASLIALAGLTYVARSMATKTETGPPQPRHRASQSRGPVSFPPDGPAA